MPARLSLEEKISRMTERHQGFYDYSRFEDLLSTDHSTVICPLHGPWEVTYHNHYNHSSGCPVCGDVQASENRRIPREEQIERMTERHQGLYTYENWGHPTSHQKSWITCQKHGDFEQSYDNHVRGKSCPKCNGCNTPRPQEDHLEEVYQTHGSYFQYPEDCIERVDGYNFITAICPIHQEFTIRLSSHKRGQGCPTCGRSEANQDPSKGHLYIRETLEDFGLIRLTDEMDIDNDYWDFDEEAIIPETAYRFDFWLPHYGLFIEFHGEQHYKGWAGKEENLERKQYNDAWKANWAEINDWDLLVIPYWDFDDIPVILAEYLGF